MDPYWTSDDGRHTLYCGDALEVLRTVDTASVALLLIDPPYRNVKAEAWDRQWPTQQAYLTWLHALALEWQRVLAPNGSLYCFASPQMAAYVEVMLGEVFTVLNRITWQKPLYSTKAEMSTKEQFRRYFPASETILFCEQANADSLALGESGYAAQCEHLRGFVFEPIRAYLDGERKRAAVRKEAINEACGFARIPGAMASRHYFSPSQWALPTAPHYAAMQRLFAREGRHPAPPFADFHSAGSPFARFHAPPDDESLRADYEFLRADYEFLRRPFTVSADVPYTDVWTFPTVQSYPGKHPCEKPAALLRHIILASSRSGDLVLDCFAGSGSTLLAASDCGRRSLGIEQEERWVRHIRTRFAQPSLFTPPTQPVAVPEQGRLW